LTSNIDPWPGMIQRAIASTFSRLLRKASASSARGSIWKMKKQRKEKRETKQNKEVKINIDKTEEQQNKENGKYIYK
jgi:hypothetical protein